MNPQRNPNVDSKRREPLTDVEIKAIEEAHRQYPELGPWNLSLLLSNEFAVHVSTMSVSRVLYPERYKSQKKIFHHDNGGEYDNGVVSRLLRMLDIVDVPTEVENPKGNGKKERAHSQDRKYFYDKYKFWDFESVEKAIPEYLRFRNESKGQWARYGKNASAVLKDA